LSLSEIGRFVPGSWSFLAGAGLGGASLGFGLDVAPTFVAEMLAANLDAAVLD
jgi:hypothetical protein